MTRGTGLRVPETRNPGVTTVSSNAPLPCTQKTGASERGAATARSPDENRLITQPREANTSRRRAQLVPTRTRTSINKQTMPEGVSLASSPLGGLCRRGERHSQEATSESTGYKHACTRTHARTHTHTGTHRTRRPPTWLLAAGTSGRWSADVPWARLRPPGFGPWTRHSFSPLSPRCFPLREVTIGPTLGLAAQSSRRGRGSGCPGKLGACAGAWDPNRPGPAPPSLPGGW